MDEVTAHSEYDGMISMLKRRQQCLLDNVCVVCNRGDALSRCTTPSGRREFRMSAICEECFDAMFDAQVD